MGGVAVGVLHRAQQAVGVPAHVEQDQVGGLESCVRPPATEGRYGGEDDVGIGLAQNVVVQTPLLKLADGKVFDDNVGGLGQLQEAGRVTGGAQVQRHSVFVGVQGQKQAALLRVGSVPWKGPHAARLVAHRRLDFDDLGSQTGQVLGAVGAGDSLSNVEYP